MWTAVKHVLKPRGVFVTTASQPFTSALVMSNLAWFRYEWIWDTVNVTGFLDVKRRPMKRHASVCVFSENGHVYNPILSGKATRSFGKLRTGMNKVDVFSGSFGGDFQQGVGYPQSIIKFQKPTNITDPESGQHPTQKPVALYEYLMRTYTNEGDTVLDFCMGSGTTGCAAVRTGRHFVGVELREDYFDISVKRITAAQAQLRLPLEEA